MFQERNSHANTFACTAANATAAVTALPTTAAHLTLRNGSTDKVYILDAVFVVITTASAAAGSTGIALCVTKGVNTMASPDTVKINCMNGKSSGYTGGATLKTGVTITDDGWWIIGGDMAGAAGTTAVGSANVYPIEGMVQIQPGGGMVSAAMLAVNTTQAGKLGFIWHEVALPAIQ